MNDLLEQFLVETRELVESATDDLLSLEGAPTDAEAVNRVFRAFHTLKGSVGLFDYPPWFSLLHAAEDGLSAARVGTLAVGAALIDLSLETLDATARWADAVEVAGALPATASEEAGGLVERYRSLLCRKPAPRQASAPAVPDWAERLVASAKGATGSASTAIRYVPRDDCFFSGDDPVGIVRKVPAILAVLVAPAAPWATGEEFDAYACNLDIAVLSAAPRPEVEAVFRLVPDQVTFVDVPADDRAPVGGAAEPTTDPGRDTLVFAILSEQLAVMAAAGDVDTAEGRLEACSRAAANVLRSAGRDVDADRCARASTGGAEAVRQSIEAALTDRSKSDHEREGGLPSGRPGRQGETVHGLEASRTLRVDAARVDALVAGVGELVVARNALSRIAAIAEAGADADTLVRSLREADATIGRLAASLHRSAVSLRLMPMSEVFRRFARPVREAARGLGKDVVLQVEGEGVDADKGIVENLFEPLLHVVRNAVDHGLEDAETRLRIGKPAAGRILIAAAQGGDGIVVSVTDDGRGIDPAFVRRRAVERGLLSSEAAAVMDDPAVVDLVFTPGFSTSEGVGALSGRGVGMDAVRAATGRMGGRVAIETHAGAGTTVRLHLPRTVALARIMVVGIDGEPYGIPLDAVDAVVRKSRSAIHEIADGAATVLRGRTVTVVRLSDLLGRRRETAARPQEALLIVVRSRGEAVALEIDGLEDRIDAVVRPPTGLIATVPVVGGTTVLGDGGVLLVLDPDALLADATGPNGETPGDARWP